MQSEVTVREVDVSKVHLQKLARLWLVKPTAGQWSHTQADTDRHCEVHCNYHGGVARANRPLKQIGSKRCDLGVGVDRMESDERFCHESTQVVFEPKIMRIVGGCEGVVE